SDFKSWDQIKHAKEWLLFPKNIAKRLSIDQTSAHVKKMGRSLKFGKKTNGFFNIFFLFT
ncbi:hypothetical protein SAMN02745938_1401, partial [Flavobacterium psychrophilum DSM 3660]